MNAEIRGHIPLEARSELAMYFNERIAHDFAEHEQNEKNFRVAAILDRVMMEEMADYEGPIHAAELGGGAHPDRYHELFARFLREPESVIDWVDASPHMLKFAREYVDRDEYRARLGVLNFQKDDLFEYLKKQPDDSLDLAIMKYMFSYIQNIDLLFSLLAKKIKKGGRFVGTLGKLDGKLPSHSANARYLLNGEPIPEGEGRELKDGDRITIQFFQESGNPAAGVIPGAETVTWHHSAEALRAAAEKAGIEIAIGDWKTFVPAEKQDGEEMEQDVVILKHFI